MPTNEHTPLPSDTPKAPAVVVQRSTLLGPQEAGWASAAEFDAQPERRAPGRSPSAYLHGLRRHWVLATGLGVLCGAVAGVAVYIGWGPQYTAAAYFQIATSEPVRVFKAADSSTDRFVQSAYDIYKDTQAQLVKSTPVLTAALRDPTVRLGVVQRGKSKYGGDEVAWLQDQLQVNFPGDAEIMEVSLTAYDESQGEEVARVVNEVARAYKEKVLDRERNEKNSRLSELELAYGRRYDDVRSKMNELANLAKTVGADTPETARVRQQVASQLLGLYQNQYAQVRVLRLHAEADLKAQEAQLASVDANPIPQADVEDYVNNNALVKQLYAALADRLTLQGEAQRTVNPNASGSHVQRYADDENYLLAQINQLRDEAAQKIRERLRSKAEDSKRQLEVQVELLRAQEQQSGNDVAKQEAEIQRLTTSSVDLEMKRTEIDRANAILMSVQEERDKMRVELGSEQRVVQRQDAEAPKSESKKGIRIAVAVLAALMGLCVPAGGITWWDTRAQRINSAADVSKGLGLTVLGSLPTIPARVIRQLGSSSKRHQTWHLRLTESIDGIAARLLRQAAVEQTHVLLISSAGTGEGKTTLATQLAMSLARNGRRTVLVDFDLRRPAFDKVLGLPLEPGVSEVLRGQNDPSQVVHETGTDNLYVVTAGRWDRHALTALANGAAGPLFDALRAGYQFVVVDAAPILPVADTRFVSQHVDAVILTVFRDISRAPKIVAACEILEAFGVSCVEAVVTGPTDDLPDKDLRYQASPPA
jgi:succinoglycan biosynthesis transport protein ExoP